MSPTDEGQTTPESPGTPKPNGDSHHPTGPLPVDPLNADSAPAEDQDTPGAPASADPHSKTGANRKVITIIAAAVVAIVAISAILFVTLKDDDAKSDTTSQTDAEAKAAAEAEIKSLTDAFIATANTGKVSGVKDLVCQQTLDLLGDQLVDEPPASPALMISAFDKITIQGDRAMAEFTLSTKDQPDVQSTKAALQYVNQDGWKVCNS